MPAVRQPALWIHTLTGELDVHVLMARRRHLAVYTRAWCECAVKLYAEPGAELFGVGESAPHTRARSEQNDLLLDTVCSLMQLHGCILRPPRREMQPTNCILFVLHGTSG